MNEKITQHLQGLSNAQQNAPAPGMARVQNAMSNAVRCAACGGEWFFVIGFNKYANQYSSMPGGDLNELSHTQTIRICLCGEPFNPNIGGVRGGHTPNSILNDFLAALGNAKKSRAALAEQVVALAEVAAARPELEALEARIASLEAAAAAPVAEAEAPAKPAKTGKGKGSTAPEAKE